LLCISRQIIEVSKKASDNKGVIFECSIINFRFLGWRSGSRYSCAGKKAIQSLED